MPEKTPLECRAAVLAAREQFGRGEIPESQLFAAADAYIQSLKDWKKRTGRKLRIPTRAYVLRAL